ncbi:unnamed protein product [Orchesella dallaii]|uniref:Uncharacterized protein n=1 Tax=Orchesella dallaii TaxID=48710 RepID=A0ABP1S0V8_9HEXA
MIESYYGLRPMETGNMSPPSVAASNSLRDDELQTTVRDLTSDTASSIRSSLSVGSGSTTSNPDGLQLRKHNHGKPPQLKPQVSHHSKYYSCPNCSERFTFLSAQSDSTLRGNQQEGHRWTSPYHHIIQLLTFMLVQKRTTKPYFVAIAYKFQTVFSAFPSMALEFEFQRATYSTWTVLMAATNNLQCNNAERILEGDEDDYNDFLFQNGQENQVVENVTLPPVLRMLSVGSNIEETTTATLLPEQRSLENIPRFPATIVNNMVDTTPLTTTATFFTRTAFIRLYATLDHNYRKIHCG